MIVCTRSIDTLARRALGKENVVISKVEAMIELFKLDPTVSKPTREAFIVTDADVKKPKMKQDFLIAAANKHPCIKIIFVTRGKSDVVEGNGIDKVLNNPKPETLSNTISGFIEEIANKTPIISSADEIPPVIDKFVPKEFMSQNLEEIEEENIEKVSKDEEQETIKIDIEKYQDIASKPTEEKAENSIVDRIRRCNTVADVSILTKELDATRLVKDLVKENHEYAAIEDKLKGLREKMYTIMADPSIKSLEIKLEKVRALLYDKEYYKVKTNTVIEQRVEDIIEVLTTHTKSLLKKRLEELDQAIFNINKRKDIGENTFTRLAGITDERANIILELATLDKEIHNIYLVSDKLANEVAANIAEDEVDLTGNQLVNAHLHIRDENIISEDSLNTIIKILSTCDKTSEEFKNAVREISIMRTKLNKLLDLDKETIAAQAQVINFLRSNHIEETIIAETLIKKSLRVFIGNEGSGRTIVPYVLSKYKARQNTNVLYIDLTGTSKIKDYGYDAIELDDWIINRQEKQFCAVVGQIDNTPDASQRLLVTLVKAADYYRVINIVISPEQEEVFQVIASDVLCVNYITDTNNKSFLFMKDLIKRTKYENVAQRVILNKCSISCEPIVEALGLLDTLDINIVKIPFINQIIECSLKHINPDVLSVVEDGFREVSKYA